MDIKKQFRIFGIPVWEQRGFTLESPPGWFMNWLDSNKSSSGEDVNWKSSMTFSAVYASVKIISETIASLGIGLFERTEKGVFPATDNQSFDIITGNPSPLMLRMNFWESMLSQVLLWGNGYAIIKRDRGMKPIELILIDQTETQVQVKKETLKGGQTDIMYEVDGINAPFNSMDILHIAGLGFNGVVGMSVMENFRESVGMAIAQKSYGGNFYKNNAQFGAILEHPAVLSEAAQKRLTDSLNKSHVGAGKAFNSFVLEEGMKYTKTTMPMTDAQFIESYKVNIEDVARMYTMPLHMLAELTRSTNNNIEVQDIGFAKHTIRPWLKRIEPEIERKLLTEKDKKNKDIFVKFNLDSLLRGDIETRSEYYNKMLLNGTFNRDEVRRLENLNPIKTGGGTIHTIQGQNIPLEDVGKEQKDGTQSNNIPE